MQLFKKIEQDNKNNRENNFYLKNFKIYILKFIIKFIKFKVVKNIHNRETY